MSTSPNNFNKKIKKTNYGTNKEKKNNINKIISEKRINNESNNNLIYENNEQKLSVNKRNNSYGKRKIREIIIKKNNNIEKEKNKDIENGKRIGNISKSPLSRSVNLSNENYKNNLGLKYPKYVNRAKDSSFVNQKMVIKPDPNKSIFNSNKNMAFFQQAENQNNDVIVITKENKGNYNTFNHFYKPKKRLNNNNKKEIEEEQENNINIRAKIDKDYENSINNINKLITLDAKIKTDNNKHIEHFNNSLKDENNSNNNKNIEYNDIKNDENKDKNESKENNNNVNNSNLINILLTEVRALSNKQISLLDLMDEIQTNTQQQIEDLNQKIVDLNITVKDLNHQLYILQQEQL